MRTALQSLLALLLATLGLLVLTDAHGAAVAALVIGALALAALAAHALSRPASVSRHLTQPDRQIGRSVLVASSNPDAKGHARPRAPGLAA